MTWTREVELRSSDIDFLGHVTATAYLSFFDENRALWLAEAWQTNEPRFVVAVQRIEYRRELRLSDGPVSIAIDLRKVGTSSFEVHETLSANAGDERARSDATLVAWDADRRGARPLTSLERTALGDVES